MKTPLIVLVSLSGFASASPYFSSVAGQHGTDSAPQGGVGPTITLDLSGLNSFDLQGDPDNEHLNYLLFRNAHIIGIGWDVHIETYGNSWLSDAVLGFENQFFLTPGVGNDSPGTASFNSGGIIDLLADGMDFYISPNGIGHIEFFESFDDNADEVDAHFMAGSSIQIQFDFPAPGGLAIVGFAGLLASRRHR